MSTEPNIQPGRMGLDDDTVVEDIDLNETEVVVDGERLTDERAEQIAAEVLAKARAYNGNLVPGGKSLSGGNKHSPVVQVRVSEATGKKLKAIAKDRRMSVSKLSRQVLDDFVARNA